MERGKEQYSDKQVVRFLIVAILISLVSTSTVLLTLNEVKSAPIIKQPHQSPTTTSGQGLISLTILEKEEQINATK